jgi:predicted secreted Zn-dependent protease
MLFAAPPLSMDVPPPNRFEIPQAPSERESLPGRLRKLSEVPGVTIIYYDAVGRTIPQLHDWLAKHGPRDGQTHKVTAATSSWSIGTAVKFTKTAGKCVLTSANVKFNATAQLPRLTPDKRRPASVVSTWSAYIAALEDRQAAQLAFVEQRLHEVETAIMSSDCGNWQKAAGAAISRLSDEQAQAFKPDPKSQPRLLEPDPAS